MKRILVAFLVLFAPLVFSRKAGFDLVEGSPALRRPGRFMGELGRIIRQDQRQRLPSRLQLTPKIDVHRTARSLR